MKLSSIALLIFATLAASNLGHAQSIDDLELRKRAKQTKIGFGVLGVLETAAALNRDRPELSNMIFVAPQLKIGDRMRVRLNAGFIKNWLDRQDNPWDFTDISLQFSHLGFYKDPWLGVSFSGYGRYYFPTSKASRDASSYGQLRLVGKASRSIGPVFLAFELNGQKYFHAHTTWSTEETVGSDEWLHSAGREDYILNNSSYGFGETFTASVSPISGLDLSLIWSMYQSRHYQPEEGHGKISGSSFVTRPRNTDWVHFFRFVSDATYNLGALPWLSPGRFKDKVLSRTFLSLGYFILAPQLQNGGRERSLNPFNPKYAKVYLDLMVIY